MIYMIYNQTKSVSRIST